MAKEKKPHMCSGCRKRKILVHHVARLGYCEECKHKAPKSVKEFEDFINEKVSWNSNLDYKKDHGGYALRDVE